MIFSSLENNENIFANIPDNVLKTENEIFDTNAPIRYFVLAPLLLFRYYDYQAT